jgi:hypothetical protein
MPLAKQRALPGLAVATILAVAAPFQPASAAGDDASRILKAMSDYLTGQKEFSATYNSDIEVITPDLQKIQFASSGAIRVHRPDRIWASRTGGYSDIQMFFDGTTLTVYGRNINRYFQSEAPGSIENLIGKQREHSISIPAADLLLPDVEGKLMAGVIDAKHVGLGVIDGFECEHLAFRTHDTDWQLWVQTGKNPLPRKLVITSKALGAAPQYTIVIKDWRTDVPPDAAAFTFKIPVGASKMRLEELKNLDKFPPSAAAKGDQP